MQMNDLWLSRAVDCGLCTDRQRVTAGAWAGDCPGGEDGRGQDGGSRFKKRSDSACVWRSWKDLQVD